VSEFEITRVVREGDVHLLALSGDFDLATVPEVDSALALLETASPPVIGLDLRGLQLIDSTALRTILDADKRAKAKGRRFAVVAPASGPVGRLLELTLIGGHIEVVEDPSDLAPGPEPG
jgi:anti-anti-sigma factor